MRHVKNTIQKLIIILYLCRLYSQIYLSLFTKFQLKNSNKSFKKCPSCCLFFLFLWTQVLFCTYGWPAAINTMHLLHWLISSEVGGKAWGSFTLLRLSSPLGPGQTSLVNSRPRSNMLVPWSQHPGKCVDDGKPVPEEIASVSSANALQIRVGIEMCAATAASERQVSGSHFGSLVTNL